MKKIPFLTIFSLLAGRDPAASLAAGWEVTAVSVSRRARTVRVQALCAAVPDDAKSQAVETALAECYGLQKAVVEFTTRAPKEEAAPPPLAADSVPAGAGQEPGASSAAAPAVSAVPAASDGAAQAFQRTEELRRCALKDLAKSAGQEKRKPAEKRRGKILYGQHPIKREPQAMSSLELDMGMVVVKGDVFAVAHKELKKRGAWVVSFDMTDYTGSVRVNKFFPGDAGKALVEGVRTKMTLLVQGRLNIDHFTNDMILEPYVVMEAEREERTDHAPEKRVELHLHTTMSMMDALTPAGEAVKRAESWGHRAIAITDHGVAQAFPDAWHAAKRLKVLYGVEAYFINDVDDRVAIHGELSQDFRGEIVCFDLETTGLDSRDDRIIEIGAAVLRDGQICETFNTFADPGRRLSREIIELTGITDSMLAGAPSQEEAVNAFLAFAGARPLAAHNAEFDIGFISQACRRMDRPFANPWIDTLIMAQNLLPDLGKHKLDIVAQRLNLPSFNHHRASDDAGMVGYMLLPFFRMLEDMGVTRLEGVNAAMRTLRGRGKAKRRPKHLIVLAKNQLGLRNLYRLISQANLQHFKRFPIMPKSEVEAWREGLIIGSACSAGELYEAILRHKDWNELKRIASWYDFLELQPICNNAYLLRPDPKTGRSQVSSQEELREFNRTIVRLAKELDKPFCATGDVHFMDPEDEIYRHILLDSKGFEDCDEPLPIYFKTTDEMLEEFAYLGKEDCYDAVVRYPNLVADLCERMDPLPQGLFAPKLENSDRELEGLVYQKAHELYGEELPKVVQDRIDLELPGIIKRKYDVIYMSAQKLVQNSLENGYLVGSRGSVGSSIVAFLSGITEVNSLPAHYRCPVCKHADFDFGPAHGYGCGADMPDAVCPECGSPYVKDGFNIPFETFLGFGGAKVPDIDLNFSGEYQAKAHRYTFELFGDAHVFRAGTIATVAEKTAFGYVKKYLEKRGLHVSRAEENRLAMGCTGVKRTTGQHPGGMVVIPQDREIYDFCPVQHPADDAGTDIVTTHFEYHSMESNLLKLDMLGHDDPTMIRMLEELTGVNARTDIRLDDADTMSLFTTSEKLGFTDDPVLGPTGAVAIPEFNTPFTRQMLMDTNPRQFNTLVRLSGFSHGTDVWLGNARDLILNQVATVDSTVGCRDDIMLYLMQQGVAPKMAFQIMEAVRKGKVKKGGFQEGWVEEMRAHQVPEWYIDSLAKIGYLFPKAHAVAYVMMAFRIAWFKVHRPLAFYAAFFSIRAKAFDATFMCRGMDVVKTKLKEIRAKRDDKSATAVEEDIYTTLEVVYEFYLRGLTFRSVDIYRSHAVNFIPDGSDALIPPFVAIPGLGETAAQSIVEQRAGQEFVSIEEFAEACPKVSKTHIEMLKTAGAFGEMPDTSQITLF